VFPILLAIGPFKLFGYGAAITLGGALSARLMWNCREKAGLRDEESYWALINIAALSGFAGGKLLFMLQYGVREGFSVMAGYSAFGGFVSVPLAVAGFAYWKKIPFVNLIDHMFPIASFWHAFGRLGCFLAGCCYGKPTDLPWGVAFRDPRSMIPAELLGARLHPVQLYEAAADLVVAWVLFRVVAVTDEKGLRPGLAAAGYLAAYAVLRSSLELVRADTLPFLGPLTQGQALGAGLLAASAALLAWRSRCSPSC
jgi:phosphatidylglycerol:prolipoprotein diacylglycerol transferase